MITLFLLEQKALSAPVLYISYSLKKNRVEYYDRMSEVRRTGNYEQWVIFFLRAIEEAARDGLRTIDELTALHEKNLAAIEADKRTTGFLRALFGHIESNPIVTIGSVADSLGVSFNTARRGVRILVDLGVLRQISSGRRNMTYAYEDYLRILRSGTTP